MNISKNKKYNGLKPIKLYFKPGVHNDILKIDWKKIN